MTTNGTKPDHGEQAFLGRGWSFPPCFGRGGKTVAMVSGTGDIHQSLQILLATRLGERVMQDKFGCDLTNHVFDPVNRGMINSLTALVSDAILYHEPRIKLDRLSIAPSKDEPGLLLIGIEYTVRSTNSRFNMVYPFSVTEATGPAV